VATEFTVKEFHIENLHVYRFHYWLHRGFLFQILLKPKHIIIIRFKKIIFNVFLKRGTCSSASIYPLSEGSTNLWLCGFSLEKNIGFLKACFTDFNLLRASPPAPLNVVRQWRHTIEQVVGARRWCTQIGQRAAS
jgi:hypothetical protein